MRISDWSSDVCSSDLMRYGVTMFATDLSMDVVELAREAEARGLQSLWLPEHTHIPASRRTPPPGGQDVLPEEYRRSLDPLVRSEEHTSELQSLMRSSYDVFCLKNNTKLTHKRKQPYHERHNQ